MTTTHYHQTIITALAFLFWIILPLTANADNADEMTAEELFSSARFDFSAYRPDPRPDDLYTVYHIIPAGPHNRDYHESVYSLGTILSRDRGSIPGSSGYYLSRSKYHPHAVRLTLFTRDELSAKELADWISGLEKDKLISIVPYVSKKPEHVVFTKNYSGDEAEFRRFLARYSPIALECMAYSFKDAQKIWFDLMDSGGTDITFLERSEFFTRLSYEERCKFIQWMFNNKWGHMIINFVLGYDEGK